VGRGWERAAERELIIPEERGRETSSGAVGTRVTIVVAGFVIVTIEWKD
jgi:hypothetical protein